MIKWIKFNLISARQCGKRLALNSIWMNNLIESVQSNIGMLSTKFNVNE